MDLSSEHIAFPQRLMKILRASELKKSPLVKILIGLFVLVLIALMYPYTESVVQSYSVGSIWADKDLVAAFSFPVYKESHQYDREVSEAKSSVYPVFERKDSTEQIQVESLRVFMETLRAGVDARLAWLKTHSKEDSSRYDKASAHLYHWLSSRDLTELVQWRSAEKKGSRQLVQRLSQTLPSILNEVYRIGLVDREDVRQYMPSLALRRGTDEEIIPAQRIFGFARARSFIDDRCSVLFGKGDTSEIARKILEAFLRPNLVYNEHETDRSRQIAREDVPRTVGYVQEGEHIINYRERITDEVKLKLDSYFRARSERGAEHSVLGQRMGIFFHAGLILFLFCGYLFLFRKKIYHDNALLALLALVLLMETFFGYLSVTLDVTQPIQYLILVPAASMLLTIIFDSRVGFYGTVTMAFLIAGIRGNDYGVSLASMVAGTLSAYAVRDIHHRMQVFRSVVFIFLGYAVTIVALALERFEPISVVTVQLTFALANAVVSPVITSALLLLFERLFKVTTDMTLYELSDANHPVLRELSEHAPGTFHHSMTLGNLAEAAAEAIGANPILARVGAYYHDIGKIHKPEYFVENQIGTVNRHNRLKPRMSALIITSHVKEGIELGKKHGLPQTVLDFIPQHHGTTRISFFFDKALKQAAAKKNPKDTINEEDFRYPGPKPQSKETGVVMLADSVEASTRSIAEMTPQRLESAIENMIKHRFLEGELDECDLTLRDLSKIKDAFLPILMGMHHQRIEYPEQKPDSVPEQAPAEPVKAAEELPPEPAPAMTPPADLPATPPGQVSQPDTKGQQQ